MNTSVNVKPPSRRESFTLRLMILSGFVCMVFFVYSLLADNAVGYAPLYWCLVAAMVFGCMKVLYEWFHYFFITVPVTPPLQKQFTVDVFTTFCKGEPYAMIVETLEAVQAITYPHTTYLCDEADDPYLKEICKNLGVIHVTRIKKINAKAGNINNALQQATGELCLVLDPDHVPEPGFLDPIISHFNNEKIGYVQVVQAYKNYDDSLIAKGAAQQTYQFYGPIMMTMNRLGTVLAIGANCTFRRTALDSIGGHAAGLAEDMHTSMQLHAKGWQSVYVPAVVARGLVPNTLSAYYSQQLKWARGVFELWVTSYIKLFTKFTWKQKIHYGLIPMHYLSGFLFLINFMVPVIALVFDVSPIKIDFGLFALAGFPLIVFIFLIRHYVQKWVMEDKERGFHMVGGLLMIGTWWVYITGFVYTIFRKKVPYIPTPKDDHEEDNWRLNIPNVAVLFISLAAIVYGLNYDWNPYNIIMAGFALLNCFILAFNIWASRQYSFKKRTFKQGWVNTSVSQVKKYKGQFWLLRRRIYGLLRKAALPVTIAVLAACFWVINMRSVAGPYARQLAQKESFFITGIYAPAQTDGLSTVSLVKEYEHKYQTHFNIQSFYISWGNKPNCFVPFKLMDSVYSNGAIPMITWEPWGNLFQNDSAAKSFKDEKIFAKIVAGNYDTYLTTFSQQLRDLKRPVYLRFAHEADNPFYPWSATGNNTTGEFKAAWKYVHEFFTAQGAKNVIWVWNPWKPAAVNAYFPGKEYVDWIGVTALNFGSYNVDKKWYSFSELYSSFHYNPIFRQGIPVMLAETGSLPSEGRQADWFKEMFSSIGTKFPEIKGVVLFNSPFDKNVPGKSSGSLNWITGDTILKSSLHNQHYYSSSSTTENKILTTILQPAEKIVKAKKMLADTRGVNYTKGQEWYKNYHHFTKKELLHDFEEMKAAGINTIKYYGPSVFDHNMLGAAARFDMRIHYGFWIPGNISLTGDNKELTALNNYILQTVRELKNNPNVTAWNIGNNVFQTLAATYDKPALLYQRDAYLQWLRELVTEIKKIDNKRPVTINIDVDEYLLETTQLMANAVPQIDAFGLVLNEKAKGKEFISQLKYPWFYSKIRATSYIETLNNKLPAFITGWQDQERKDYVSFDGLKDIWGRNKQDLQRLSSYWKSNTVKALPEIKILKTAAATFVNAPLTYHAVVLQNNEWKLAKSINTGFEFKWVLVKTDGFGNGFFMKEMGTGSYVTFNIPEAPDTYELFVFASDKNGVVVAQSTLNTPLIAKQPSLR